MKRPLALCLALDACAHPAPRETPDAATAAIRPTPRTPLTQNAPDALDDALAFAWPDRPVERTALDTALAALAAATTPAQHRAWLFAATRRAPPTELGRVQALVRRDEVTVLARALAGRPTDPPLAELPRVLLDDLAAAHPDVATATVVSRFHLATPTPSVAPTLLVGASIDDQLAGARLLASPHVPLPDPALVDLIEPAVVPALVRSLSARTETPPATWVALLLTTAQRAQLAPRRWGNAWRAVRAAAPTTVADVRTAFETAVGIASAARGLPPATASWFRCENAAALDTLHGAPALTLTCATEGHGWIAAVAQAQVLGAGMDAPGRRAEALARLIEGAQGQPQVLEAIATAATALPVNASNGVVRRLARERDPGVEAALLEALLAHLPQARALPTDVRNALLRAAFEQPEGAALEARVEAVTLAHALHADVALPASDTIRALQQAATPDAGISARHGPGPSPLPSPRIVRVATDAGSFDLALDPAAAPAAVTGLLAAVRAGRYDGLDFHRVVPGFVAQGGDPRGDGYGGTDVPTLSELSLRPFHRGAVGVPLAGLDTGGIQFFVVLADAPHLDGRYPYLGQVTRGLDVVDGLLPGDRIVSATVLAE